MISWKCSLLVVVALVVLVTVAGVRPNALLILTPLLHSRILLAALCIVAVSVPLGDLLMRRLLSQQTDDHRASPDLADGEYSMLPEEKLLFASAFGMGILSVLMFLLASVHLYNKVSAICLMGCVAILGRKTWRPLVNSLKERCLGLRLSARSLPLILSVAIALCFALLPTVNYDALEYHLGAQSEYIRNGGFCLLPFNVYSNFPMGVEMLYGLGLLFGGDGVPQVLHCLFALLTAATVSCAVRRLSKTAADVFSPLAFLATPLVMLSCGQANIDLALAFYSSLVVLALILFPFPLNRQQSLFIGLLCGLSLAAKYTAVVQICFPAALALTIRTVKTRSPNNKSLMIKNALFFGSGVLVPFLPWAAKNLVLQGNPFFPLAYEWFGAKFWSHEAYALFQNAHASRLHGGILQWFSALGTNLLDLVAGQKNLSVFAVALPLALLRKPSRTSSALWVYVLSSFAGWFLLTHWQDRFLLPLVPACVVLAMEAFHTTASLTLKSLVRICMTSLILINLWYAFAVLSQGNAFDYLTEKTDLHEWRARGLPHFQAIDFMNESLETGRHHVLFVGEARTYGNAVRVVASTVFDRSPFLETTQEYVTAHDKVQALRNAEFTHLLYNGYEIKRLHDTYAPYGWRMAPAIESTMREIAPLLKEVFHAGHPGLEGVSVYELSR